MDYIQEIKARASLNLTNLLEAVGASKGTLCVIGDNPFVKLPHKQHCLSLADAKQENNNLLDITNEAGRFSAIVVFELGENTENPSFIQKLHGYCLSSQTPLIICALNMAYKDNVFQLFSGETKNLGFSFYPNSSCFSAKSLDELMVNEKFVLVANSDYELESTSQFIKNQNTLLAPGSLIHKHLNWAKSVTDKSGSSLILLRAYTPVTVVAKTQNKQDKTFLTVVTRTQGKRIPELRETLLCLTAQTISNFEVLIIGHKVSETDRLNVQQLIQETPASIQDRIRYISLDKGNRSTPLNLGFSLANSEYVSILDDDDLIMDNWVEVFWELSRKNSGAILHAYAIGQKWEHVALPDGLAAVSKPSTDFCHPFSFVEQLHINRCPTMSLAFPVWLFQNTDIRFDENLDTTEDWDFLMRTAAVTGVANVKKVTSIYRLWQNATSSHTLHKRKQWLANESYVRDKLNKMPILLPEGSSSFLEELHLTAFNAAHNNHPMTLNDINNTANAVLYPDDGNGYTEFCAFREKNKANLPAFYYTYYIPEGTMVKKSFRFDPAEQTGIIVYNFTVSVASEDGSTINIDQKSCSSNGYHIKKHIAFLKQDPQIYFSIPDKFVPRKIVISGNISMKISDATLDAVVGVPFLKRIYRKIRKAIG